jgi:hypothetical protein
VVTIVECFAGVAGAGAWFRVVSGRVLVRVLVRVLPVGFWRRDVGEARRINVRFCRFVRF